MTTIVRVSGGATRVSVGGATKRISLSQNTVARINSNRPASVIARPTTVNIDGSGTTVAAGNAMGVQGPQGEPGLSGAGTIPPINFSFGDAPGAVYTPIVAGVLTVVRVQMRTPFNGTGGAIRIGTLADSEAALPAAHIDPYSDHEFEATPDIALAAGEAVRITITPGTASQGSGQLFLTFIPTA